MRSTSEMEAGPALWISEPNEGQERTHQALISPGLQKLILVSNLNTNILKLFSFTTFVFQLIKYDFLFKIYSQI
jgi:hypothetical protein